MVSCRLVVLLILPLEKTKKAKLKALISIGAILESQTGTLESSKKIGSLLEINFCKLSSI